jgi:hypothetical protein
MLNHSPRMSELLDSVLTVTTFTIGYPFLLNETSIEFGGVWQDCTDISRVSFYSHKDNILRGLFKISINNLRISIMLREWSKVKQVTHCHTFTNNVARHYRAGSTIATGGLSNTAVMLKPFTAIPCWPMRHKTSQVSRICSHAVIGCIDNPRTVDSFHLDLAECYQLPHTLGSWRDLFPQGNIHQQAQ